MSVLYDRIHALCDAKGVKDGTMCRESGVARSTFQELKMGRTESLSLKNLHKIADYFGVSISELTGEAQKEKPTPGEGSGLDAKAQATLDKMKKLSPEQQEAFWDMLNTTIDAVLNMPDGDGNG
nr:MAG TPA: Cro/C1-type HTH DNA-binding domain protein [Caudoviricetes sp.]